MILMRILRSLFLVSQDRMSVRCRLYASASVLRIGVWIASHTDDPAAARSTTTTYRTTSTSTSSYRTIPTLILILVPRSSS